MERTDPTRDIIGPDASASRGRGAFVVMVAAANAGPHATM